jgi:predicted metalloprotease
MGAGGLGAVGMLGMVALLALGNCLGGSTGSQQDYGSVFGSLPQVQPAATGRLPLGDGQGQDVALYVSAVVDDVQQTWANVFQESGRRYRATKLVL